MPLSEQEQRLLEEMERSLYQNDADFVATVGGHHGRPNYRAIVLGILLAILGIAALVTGVILQQIVIGVLGFAAMLGGVLVSITPPKHAKSTPRVPGAAKRPTQGHSFMDRMNDRWEKRQDGH